MEMDDKAPRAVPANSGHVASVTSPVSWERDHSAPLGVSDSRLAEANGQVKQCTAIEGALG